MYRAYPSFRSGLSFLCCGKRWRDIQQHDCFLRMERSLANVLQRYALVQTHPRTIYILVVAQKGVNKSSWQKRKTVHGEKNEVTLDDSTKPENAPAVAVDVLTQMRFAIFQRKLLSEQHNNELLINPSGDFEEPDESFLLFLCQKRPFLKSDLPPRRVDKVFR